MFQSLRLQGAQDPESISRRNAALVLRSTSHSHMGHKGKTSPEPAGLLSSFLPHRPKQQQAPGQ